MSNEPSATIREVAAKAGVSIATVSNVINGTKNVAPDTQAKVDGAIAALGFVPNRAVRTLRGMRISTIGLVVPDALNPFFVELWRTVQHEIGLHGHTVMLCDTRGDMMVEREQLRHLAEMRVQGVLLTSVDDSRVDLSALQSTGARTVLLGDPKAGTGAPSINIDQRRSGYLAARHLLASGRRHLVFAGGPRARHLLEERVEGVRAAIAESSHPEATFHRIDADAQLAHERMGHAQEILATAPRTDGVICANDVIAIGLVNNFHRLGARVPDDVAVVGHDGIQATADAAVPITTIRQPLEGIAEHARELLISAPDADPVHVVLSAELVIRASA